MEAILGLVVLLGLWVVFNLVFNAGAKTVHAATRTAMGKGSMSENMGLAFQGMPELTIRFRDTTLGDDGTGPSAKLIEARGLFPLHAEVNAAIVVSVMDVTDEEPAPVIVHLDDFQEEESIAFQHTAELGTIRPNQGFPGWVQVGAIFPQLLHPPLGGKRDLIAMVRLLDIDDPAPITYGFCDSEHPGHLWAAPLPFALHYPEKGYEEESEDRDEACALTIKVGMAVAMADGSLGDDEGMVLKTWIIKAISVFGDSKQEELKKRYNNAMREAYDEAVLGDLSLSRTTQRLREVGETSAHYDALELCFDIMAADGKADPEEMKTIRAIASALELDVDELESMRDKRIVRLDTAVVSGSSAEELLGIESDWDQDRVAAHLRGEFQKWNNRIVALPVGPERENAQRMIDLIAEARRRSA